MGAIKKYRLKPETLEVSDPVTQENLQEIAAWCGGNSFWPIYAMDQKPEDEEIEFWANGELVLVAQGERVAKGTASFYKISDLMFTHRFFPEPLPEVKE